MTAGSARPTRRLSGRLRGVAGRPAREEAGSPSCWPRGTRASSWPASSGSRSRGSASFGTELEAGWRAFQGPASVHEAGDPRMARV